MNSITFKNKLRPLSDEIKNELAAVRDQGNSVLDSLQSVLLKALVSIHGAWRQEPIPNKKAMWDHVSKEAKRILVDKQHGGGADHGWTLGTFQNYISRVKKAIVFQVDIYTAESETTELLREAQIRAEKLAEDAGSMKTEKFMVAAIKAVKVDREARAKANAEKEAVGHGFHGLPNPNEFKDDEALALGTIKQFYSYLGYIQDRIKGDSDAEKLLRKIQKQVVTYKEEHSSEFAEFEEVLASAAA